MILLWFWMVLAVVRIAARRGLVSMRRKMSRRTAYVPRHSYELMMDQLWSGRLAQMAERRRALAAS